MKTYPNKLLILFPMYVPVDYRYRLSAIDDALAVHRSPSGEYQFELRPMVKLAASGANSHASALARLAADLETGYTVVIVERDRFLADLEALARAHPGKDKDAVERAAQIVAERTTFQVRDHLDCDSREHLVTRKLVAARPRQTKLGRDDRPGPNCIAGMPTPRTERLWHVIRDELADVRANQAGYAAWERWARQNRPDMPLAEK